MMRDNKKKVLIFGAVVGLLVFLSSLGILSPFVGFTDRIFSPSMKKLYGVGSGLRKIFDNQADKKNIFSENEELRTRVATLTEENVELELVRQENKLLREHLNFFNKNNYRYVMSSIISRGDIMDISDKSEVVTIDKGLRDGLVAGLAVVNSQGVVVGKVAEVKESISLVYLTNNSKCKLAASILGQDGTEGVTEGDRGLTIKMGFIPQAKEIKKDDIVISSGLEYLVPRGLVIGRIIEVNKDNNELWQNAVIEPVIDNDSLTLVSVLLPLN